MPGTTPPCVEFTGAEPLHGMIDPEFTHEAIDGQIDAGDLVVKLPRNPILHPGPFAHLCTGRPGQIEASAALVVIPAKIDAPDMHAGSINIHEEPNPGLVTEHPGNLDAPDRADEVAEEVKNRRGDVFIGIGQPRDGQPIHNRAPAESFPPC